MIPFPLWNEMRLPLGTASGQPVFKTWNFRCFNLHITKNI